MARSLGLMAIVIVALLFLGPSRALIFPGADRRPPVDYRAQVTGFSQVTGLPAVVPSSLPTAWQPNAARLSSTPRLGEHLRIGWATPGDRFAGLDEADGDPVALIRLVLGHRGSTVQDQVQIGPVTWDVRASDRGERALTAGFGAVSVVLTGSATADQLRLLAASLG
jgi:hypothetical protein